MAGRPCSSAPQGKNQMQPKRPETSLRSPSCLRCRCTVSERSGGSQAHEDSAPQAGVARVEQVPVNGERPSGLIHTACASNTPTPCCDNDSWQQKQCTSSLFRHYSPSFT